MVARRGFLRPVVVAARTPCAVCELDTMGMTASTFGNSETAWPSSMVQLLTAPPFTEPLVRRTGEDIDQIVPEGADAL